MDSEIEKKLYPLTYPQKSIWYLEKLNPDTGIGNILASMTFEETIDYGLMNEAVNQVIARNDGLRLRITEQNGQPMQYVADYSPYCVEYFDFSRQGKEAQYAWDQKQARIQFNLFDSNLFYFAVVKTDDNAGFLFSRINHLIADAWSLVQTGNEISKYYRLLKSGQPLPDETNPSYLEFIENELEYMKSVRFEQDRQFWLEKYAQAPELTTLKSRSSNRIGLVAHRKSFVVPDKLAEKVKKHCAENRTSIFALFFAALCIYINRVKDTQDITIGTPVLNRTNFKDKKTLGMFISTVPLRINVDGEQNFVEFSKIIDREWYAVLKHQKYPYDCLMRDVREHSKDTEKLFDLAISYQNGKITNGDEQNSNKTRWHFNGFQVESLYLHINDRDDDGKIILNFDFLTDHYYFKEIDFIHDHIIRLLWHALDNPAQKLSQIHMLSEKELKKVISTFNDGQTGYPREATITGLFEAQAARTPDAVALVFGKKTLTYRELNNRANVLAGVLRDKGVGPEVIVGLLLPRSLEMIVGILGVVKAGGAYLPIDPDYPVDRISYTLKNSRTHYLLTQDGLAGNLNFKGEIIDIFQLPQQEAGNPVPLNKPEDLLYVIYTSGSTGRPKGAMIEHRNVVRLLFNDGFQFDFGAGDCWTLFHSYCFDFSVWEMYGALLYGGKLVIVPREVAQDTRRFIELLKKERVTILNQTPAAFYNLVDAERLDAGSNLAVRTVIFGGEALKPIMLKPFRDRYPQARLVNMYGITETTVHVTYKELSNEDIARNVSNIGKPIPTLKVYILDKRLNPLPIGMPGELCVSGAGVGRGYLNNPGLTAERFVPNPFAEGEIMYRSGDLARYFSQGDIEYLGRIDNQVKIRGHRIELGEIESEIIRFDRVKEAVVLTRDSLAGNKQLCAYFVASADFAVGELRSFLEKSLPDYMVPSFFIRVDKIPLNANGKVDRTKLPEPDQEAMARDAYEAPQTEFQADIAKIWQEVLGVNRIGINDNFFQMGGDSLNAVVIVSMIGHGMTFADLYANPTIKGLSEALENQQRKGGSAQLLLKLFNSDALPQKNIICFPYGGGNGIIYKELADAIVKVTDQYSIYTVNLPGRDPGQNEDLKPNDEIAARLIDEIKSTINGEIILYGHCVGSALTVEIARALREENIEVKSVFLGGILPPGKSLLLGRNFDPWKLMSNKNILDFLKWIGFPRLKVQQEYADIMIRSFRHDVRSYYRYFYDYQTRYPNKLDVPINCVVGEKDLITRNYRNKVNRWKKYSDDVNLFTIEDARHYFIKTNADELALILSIQK